jgi:hypothetical protein
MDNLTNKQRKDYAMFLPATSSFYSSFIGYQRMRYPYIDPARIPAHLTNDVESLNFLDPNNPLFYYKWCLYSAGHANLDLNKQDDREEVFRKRVKDGNSWVLGDSGGFQIGKGKWPGDWKDPNCPHASKKRKQVLEWMDSLMDYGMVLDIPAWVARSPEGAKATGISTYQEAVNATRVNNDYFINNRTGACKFLNVLQGENHTDAEDWYQQMKDYCDPNKYPNNHFNGWAMCGQNMCDVHLILKRIVSLHYDGLLLPGLHDWMHFLGTSKLEWALLLTDIQRAVQRNYNENFRISFDCASPFLGTANGQVYRENRFPHNGKWSYIMGSFVDNKNLARDTRWIRDAVIQEGAYDNWEDSPISKDLKLGDICVYGPGDVNKIGKEGKTSWDSFSYCLLMNHNVWMHLTAVQEANRRYDAGEHPAMMWNQRGDYAYFRDIVNDIFSAPTKDASMKLIDKYDNYWMDIQGTRGYTGKKAKNANTMFNALFIEEA